ncbi:MAG: DUF4214 domain-containing protein [Chitinispirillaceae bacterium]|nr:DUF4214 domain-containing protein [Chitinispirillaceae bacterium]
MDLKTLTPIAMLFFIGSSFAAMNAEIVSTSIPVYINPGSTARIEVTVKNTGDTWYANQVWLYPSKGTQFWGVNRVYVNRTVRRNYTFTFAFDITAPGEKGTYSMVWQMGSTNTYLFGQSWSNLRYVYFIPNQYIAKLYSEALGRAPDQAGWQGWINHFKTNGCTAASLRDAANAFFTSAEYQNMNYTPGEQIVTVYRALLNREPDQGGFDYWSDQLNSGVPLTTLIAGCINSSEFNGKINQIANGESYGWSNEQLPLAPDVTLPAPHPGTERFDPAGHLTLQQFIASRPDNTIIEISRGQVIYLDETLLITAGKTLRTYQDGTITPQKYAAMARLVRRAATPNWYLVRLESGARLENIWLDGQDSRLNRTLDNAIGQCLSGNVHILGGDGTSVIGCRLDETMGWTTIFSQGEGEGVPAALNVSILNNVITCYNTTYTGSSPWPWSDGISCASENTTISGNTVFDATDVPIILFGFSSIIQNSDIINNTILNSGNTARAAICIAQNLDNADFQGSSINSNTIWTGTRAVYQICLCLGTTPFHWQTTPMGSNASARGNTSGILSVNCNMGIHANNFSNITVLDNTFTFNLINSTGLPLLNVSHNATGVSHGSTSFQSHVHVANVLVDGLLDD